MLSKIRKCTASSKIFISMSINKKIIVGLIFTSYTFNLQFDSLPLQSLWPKIASRVPASENQSEKKCIRLLSALSEESGLLSTRAGYGDLTVAEVNQIQAVVDSINYPIIVVGSAAKSERRNHSLDLPIGKAENEKSDIDYALPFPRIPREERLKAYHFSFQIRDQLYFLPDMDAVFARAPYPNEPRVWFIPNQDPIFVPISGVDPLPKYINVPLDSSNIDLIEKISPSRDPFTW